MKSYRLYFLDHNGHIRRAVEMECESDDQAIDAVEQHRDARAMELWQQARKVKAFAASDPA